MIIKNNVLLGILNTFWPEEYFFLLKNVYNIERKINVKKIVANEPPGNVKHKYNGPH